MSTILAEIDTRNAIRHVSVSGPTKQDMAKAMKKLRKGNVPFLKFGTNQGQSLITIQTFTLERVKGHRMKYLVVGITNGHQVLGTYDADNRSAEFFVATA